jgi:acetate kinase
MAILVLNAGSTSVKAGLFDIVDHLGGNSLVEPVWSGQVSVADHRTSTITITDADGSRQSCLAEENSFKAIVKKLLELAENGCSGRSVDIVGHRVVHGGAKYSSPVLVDEKVMIDLQSFVSLAPEHELSNISGIRIAGELFEALPQVAVFDTAFHQSVPEHHRVYALPYDWYRDLGVRRYGFHGISHHYCATRVAEMLGKPLTELRLVTCHLGGGASLAAISGGTCQMTTMGYTPLEGLIMSSRCGSIDTGIVLQMLIDERCTAKEMLRILNEESGLKGVSGLSGDMREIQAAAERNNERAKLALAMYIASLHKHIGASLGVLGGIDAIAFTGGVGENSDWVRTEACKPFEFLGMQVDTERNTNGRADRIISADNAKVATLVVKAREELAIAKECLRFL